MGLFSRTPVSVTAETALPGRNIPLVIPETHYVNGTSFIAPFPTGLEIVYFGMGCFWGAERRFWEQEGVYTTAVGYAGGFTENPTYDEVCSGLTAHSEMVLVVFDPKITSLEKLLTLFWESHDPTQGMRQGNDIGSQYRSCIFTTSEEQFATARNAADRFQQGLTDSGYGAITTDIESVSTFFYAEEYHQQYLAKVPNGYCGLRGTGVCYVAPE
ncbi:peptide-methionine (S)-S-oxide reductase MsrA [Pseudomonadales bacterium]|jgi:peptide-methionine (S)-S-oxide reductase|nr:peptide-methionine (S)-S-oxide reductase MsrA [Pseudomonadales bacterium]MDG1002725.1 peptide-methionine (S)-S-oxide reductase MsrA [Pseudomonadales bacterium]MDG1305971.1 peptide-methionine (S)-S-oxide reductase MsrA [Pseudomonadales bacterium]MDG1909587.1 peptide-methionine (S)-S-oxide reductase MsrA [Pseudomonadales bacterium]|tara:strand:+ start:497 stop:1138 length:642 start_codon:yes stop_codon:yes gene_type:complete